MEQAKILIVEDHLDTYEAMRKYIDLYLGDKDPIVLHAPDMATCLSMCRIRGPIDVIILDIGLPDSKSENTLRYIPSLPGLKMVVSGSGGQTSRRDAYRHGANDYIEKPVVAENFIDHLTRMLQQARPGDDFTVAQHKAQQATQQKAELAQAVIVPPPVATTNGARLRKAFKEWSPVICGVIIAAFFVMDRWKGATLSGANVQNQLTQLTNDLKEEKKQREEFQRESLEVRKQLVQKLETIHGENEASKAERADLKETSHQILDILLHH